MKFGIPFYNYKMPTPVSREFMQALKAKRDEEKRIEKVNKCVESIYNQAIHEAEASDSTLYTLHIHPGGGFAGEMSYSDYKFYTENMEDILSGLQYIFPGCNVKFAKMCSGNDGMIYDVTSIGEKIFPFVDPNKIVECIVIDWS